MMSYTKNIWLIIQRLYIEKYFFLKKKNFYKENRSNFPKILLNQSKILIYNGKNYVKIRKKNFKYGYKFNYIIKKDGAKR
uniref:Ribosomal protein S19 n=1 Tax=Gruberia lanceolata TaxID=1978530 RepID=A0A6C0UA52_9CILI|nr:ribosomal protein S19 [Gruberia lanceolata]